jgi:hypothetical protein
VDAVVCVYKENALPGDYHARFIADLKRHTRAPFLLLVNAHGASDARATPFLAPRGANPRQVSQGWCTSYLMSGLRTRSCLDRLPEACSCCSCR